MEKLQGGEQHLSSLLQRRLVTDAGWEPKHDASAGRPTPCSAIQKPQEHESVASTENVAVS